MRNSVESLFCFCNKNELGSKEREFKIKPEAWKEWVESARITALSIYQTSKKKDSDNTERGEIDHMQGIHNGTSNF